MSKIVIAVNAMLSKSNLIGKVLPNYDNDEYFFMYDNKYKWSISYNVGENNYNLFYYPSEERIEDLVRREPGEWEDSKDFIRYSSKEIGTKEAQATFQELYSKIKEMAFGVNQVLDDIIGNTTEGY